MSAEIIRKTRPPGSANVPDLEAARAAFSWDAARAALAGLPGGGLNIAHEAVHRHVAEGRGERVALRCLDARGGARDVTYAELAGSVARFAGALRALGIEPGERVASLLPRVPEVHVAALGALHAGCVFSPLFSAFGPEPIATRLEIGSVRALVTTEALYQRKVAALRPRLPALRHVLLLRDGATGAALPEGTLDLRETLASVSDLPAVAATRAEDVALLHFTSGTTGKPKGALHVHGAVVAHRATAESALDLRGSDRFWCTADPGWVTGTSYGIIAPLVVGSTLLVDEAEFDAERWYDTLARERVTVWYTAPTAVRRLMRAGSSLPRQRDLSALRFIASVGEPLNPEAVRWSVEAFGMPIHDNWWQTETGGIMIANVASMDVKPGSMGKPLPGVEAGLVRRRADGGLEEIVAAGQDGELALRPGWPSMFAEYLGEPERTRKCFADGWYLSGDLARRDEDGYYWFVGRADDVIKSSGHLIGPFEVESALMEHPAVAEAAVIGKPEAMAGEIVKAFVVLRAGRVADAALERDVLAFARARLGPAVAPRELAIVADLPRTRSGKILRRLLKARELGLPEGDLSTLEGAS